MRASLDGALPSALSSSSRRQPSVSSAPSRSLDSSGVFSPSFSSPQSAPHSSKVSFSVLHPPHHRVSQSRCTSISSASRIDGRIQSCDKSQQSSTVFVQENYYAAIFGRSARHAFLPEKIEKIQYLQRHRILNVVCVVWGYIFLVCQELGRVREAPPKQ